MKLRFPGPRLSTPTADDLAVRTVAVSPASQTVRFRPRPHLLSNRLAQVLWWRCGRPCFAHWSSYRPRHRYTSSRPDLGAHFKLQMGPYSSLGHCVDCYSLDTIRIGAYAIGTAFYAPQVTIRTRRMTLSTDRRSAWRAADVFVAPGVAISKGAVIGTRSSVFENVPEWTIAVGNPARVARKCARAVADPVRKSTGG
jgi:acetyltransferase-like isoleucine patch superfamily enzyme